MLAGITARIMGAVYRVPFQNIAGDVGYYVYQQVYPFYGIAFALAMYGFPVIISKMVAEGKEIKNGQNNGDTLVISSFVLGVLSIGLFAATFFGASMIANFMKDPLLIPAIKAVSFSFLLLPVISVLRGVYQGSENMLPTGVSQVMEQLTRVAFILCVSVIIAGNNGSPYDIGTFASFGGVLGGLVALITLLFYFHQHKINLNRSKRLTYTKVWSVTKRLIIDGFAISIAASVLILFQFIDAFEIPYLLADKTDSVKQQKGIFDRGQPLLQLGIVVATSISLSLVPYISNAYAKRDWKAIAEGAATALKLGLLLGGAAAVGLAIIITPTNIMLFENQAGSAVLGVLGISILFATIALIAAGIIQGLGKSLVITSNVLIGALVKVLINLILLPSLGIMGAAIATVSGMAVIALLNLYVLYRNVPELIKQRFYSTRIIASLLAMTLVTFGWKELLDFLLASNETNRVLASFKAFSTAIIGVVTYLLCLVKWPIWEEAELSYLPSFIARISKIRKRRQLSR